MRNITAMGRAHRVAAVVQDGTSAFEMALVGEVFGYDRSDLASPWYRFRLCSAEGSSVRTTTGFSVEVPYDLASLSWADTVVVIPSAPAVSPPVLLDALRRAHRRGARLVSICTGALVLAEAGLLDGRRATTHWMAVDELTARFPAVDVDPDVLYVDLGDIATSAGAAAGLDLCLHLVRKDLGADVANAVARRLVVPPHRDGGQRQYIEYPMVAPDEDDTLFDDAVAWARRHLDDPLTVEQLAARAAMSPRTFARRFRAVTGTTPHEWVTVERVALAQRLLETTDRPVEWIASEAGFGTAANLRQHFRHRVGVAPARYRQVFRRAATG